MFSMIRKRFTYANVAMTLALVFTMTGGAYAAKHYLITSTKQISPKVLKALKGKDGKNGAPGVTGPAGAGTAGAQGPVGPTGAKGETGPEGKQGKEGKEGEEGAQGQQGQQGQQGLQGVAGPVGPTGEPWTPNSELPSGATETGTWSAGASEGQIAMAAISFTIPLKAELDENHVKYAGKTSTTECPGSAVKPEAEKGYLCVYGNVAVGASATDEIYKGSGLEPGASTAGVVVVVKGEAAVGPAKLNITYGTWAVTAE